jgi:hypothetical protein
MDQKTINLWRQIEDCRRRNRKRGPPKPAANDAGTAPLG